MLVLVFILLQNIISSASGRQANRGKIDCSPKIVYQAALDAVREMVWFFQVRLGVNKRREFPHKAANRLSWPWRRLGQRINRTSLNPESVSDEVDSSPIR